MQHNTCVNKLPFPYSFVFLHNVLTNCLDLYVVATTIIKQSKNKHCWIFGRHLVGRSVSQDVISVSVVPSRSPHPASRIPPARLFFSFPTEKCSNASTKLKLNHNLPTHQGKKRSTFLQMLTVRLGSLHSIWHWNLHTIYKILDLGPTSPPLRILSMIMKIIFLKCCS